MNTLTDNSDGLIPIFVGCMRVVEEHRMGFFNCELAVQTYPGYEQADELRDFINENTAEIVDEVLYVMDATTGDMIWEKPEASIQDHSDIIFL